MRIVERMNRSAQPVVHVTIAGRSNGLSGVTAGSSVHPVIALPPFKDYADYSVNVHSSLQMPSETPVLTVLDPGNAALAAARILAGSDADLRQRVRSQIQTTKARFGVEVV
jgi:5-(carboxyamino)imidazole ribonucleotide mutase